MLKLGDKVYAWANNEVSVSPITNNEIIGEIVGFEQHEITNAAFVNVYSILDNSNYLIPSEHVFCVGTGPSISKEVIYEDHYV